MKRAIGVLAVALLAACGGGSGSSSAKSSSSSDDCVDRVVTMLNTLDVSKIDPNDGLDDSERSNLDDQFSSLTKDKPDLASGGACDSKFQSLPDDQAQAVIARLRPEVTAVLGASARSTFSEVGSSIN